MNAPQHLSKLTPIRSQEFHADSHWPTANLIPVDQLQTSSPSPLELAKRLLTGGAVDIGAANVPGCPDRTVRAIYCFDDSLLEALNFGDCRNEIAANLRLLTASALAAGDSCIHVDRAQVAANLARQLLAATMHNATQFLADQRLSREEQDYLEAADEVAP